MNLEGHLVSLILDYVVNKRNGRIPDYFEQVASLTLPFDVEGFKIFRILGVNDSGLVRELQQNDVTSINVQDGAVFEVNINEEGDTRFYYLTTDTRFKLLARSLDYGEENGVEQPKHQSLKLLSLKNG